ETVDPILRANAASQIQDRNAILSKHRDSIPNQPRAQLAAFLRVAVEMVFGVLAGYEKEGNRLDPRTTLRTQKERAGVACPSFQRLRREAVMCGRSHPLHSRCVKSF